MVPDYLFTANPGPTPDCKGISIKNLYQNFQTNCYLASFLTIKSVKGENAA